MNVGIAVLNDAPARLAQTGLYLGIRLLGRGV